MKHSNSWYLEPLKGQDIPVNQDDTRAQITEVYTVFPGELEPSKLIIL